MITIPPFQPAGLLSGGHRQTLFGYFFRATPWPYQAIPHKVSLPDGDCLMLHDDRPQTWQAGDAVALLMHGLSGCHGSAYMVRVARRLNEHGIRTFRLDHRGCGAGAKLARLPYHAGRSADVLAAWNFIQTICRDSPGAMIGFSLSGNMLLKLLGERTKDRESLLGLRCAAAVNPPIELHRCAEALNCGFNRLYERHFVKLLTGQVHQRLASFPDAPRPVWAELPRSLREFDDTYTAPASGFEGVDDYYSRCSSAQFIGNINVPTLILTARDDTLIPVQSFEQLGDSDHVTVHIASNGGHLGYIARRSADPDPRWMDWRLVDWVKALACAATE